LNKATRGKSQTEKRNVAEPVVGLTRGGAGGLRVAPGHFGPRLQSNKATEGIRGDCGGGGGASIDQLYIYIYMNKNKPIYRGLTLDPERYVAERCLWRIHPNLDHLYIHISISISIYRCIDIDL